MNTKAVGVLILIAVIIAVFALSSPQQTNEEGKKYVLNPLTGDEYNPEEFVDPQGLKKSLDIDSQEFDRATTSDDCERSKGFFRDMCYYNLGVINNNISFCNSISVDNFEIIDNCYYDLAIKEQNDELCMQMTFGVTDCFTDVALAKLDPAICEKASFEKSACLKAVRENSFKPCEKLGLDRRHCNDAVSNKDTSFCDNITDAGDNCFEQLALKTSNAEYCSKISSNSDYCYYEIAVKTNKYKLCELLNERNGLCVALIAFNTNNPDLCEFAGEERQRCLDDLQ